MSASGFKGRSPPSDKDISDPEGSLRLCEIIVEIPGYNDRALTENLDLAHISPSPSSSPSPNSSLRLRPGISAPPP